MARIDNETRQIHTRVVYVGPTGAGKRTNLARVYQRTKRDEAPAPDAIDGFVMTLGAIRGFEIHCSLWAAPWGPAHAATRARLYRSVDHGTEYVDALVYVADSAAAAQAQNSDVFAQLREELRDDGLDPDQLPSVIQYNKRDLPDAAPLDAMRAALNPRGLPDHEASATSGSGVFETLKSVTKELLLALKRG